MTFKLLLEWQVGWYERGGVLALCIYRIFQNLRLIFRASKNPSLLRKKPTLLSSFATNAMFESPVLFCVGVAQCVTVISELNQWRTNHLARKVESRRKEHHDS